MSFIRFLDTTWPLLALPIYRLVFLRAPRARSRDENISSEEPAIYTTFIHPRLAALRTPGILTGSITCSKSQGLTGGVTFSNVLGAYRLVIYELPTGGSSPDLPALSGATPKAKKHMTFYFQ